MEFDNELWYSLHHHGRFSNPDIEECLKEINSKIATSSENLKNADFLFITFGTSWIYRHNIKNLIVANCHKLPQNTFNKELLSIDEIAEEYGVLINSLKTFNPKLKIVFTVSPVRHWKDGAFGNQISKSILILAINKITKTFENTEYFPSYELMIDDLRDYRFYADDLLHPNLQAIKYILEKFSETFLDEESRKIIAEIEKINKSKTHRPFHASLDSHKAFLRANSKLVETLSNKYPFLNLEEEKEFFKI